MYIKTVVVCVIGSSNNIIIHKTVVYSLSSCIIGYIANIYIHTDVYPMSLRIDCINRSGKNIYINLCHCVLIA